MPILVGAASAASDEEWEVIAAASTAAAPATEGTLQWLRPASASTAGTSSTATDPASAARSATDSALAAGLGAWQVVTQKKVELMREVHYDWTMVVSTYETAKVMPPTPGERARAEVAARKDWAASLRERRAMAAHDKMRHGGPADRR